MARRTMQPYIWAPTIMEPSISKYRYVVPGIAGDGNVYLLHTHSAYLLTHTSLLLCLPNLCCMDNDYMQPYHHTYSLHYIL